MMARVRDWLPDDAMTAQRIGVALAACLDEWSRHWFPADLPVAVVDTVAALSAQGEASLSFEAGPVALLLSYRGKRHLLEAILSDSLMGKSLTLRDHQLLEQLVARVAQDLVERLANLPAIASATAGPSRTVSLTLADQHCGRLSIPEAALATLIKATTSQSSARDAALRDRRAALGPSSAAIDAMLGQVFLSVDDMHGLEPGDILILDRTLDAPLSVRLSTTGALIGKGKLTTVEGRNAVAWQE